MGVSLLGRPGVRFIGLLYKSCRLPRSLPRERIVFMVQDEDFSTMLKLAWDGDIPNPVLLVLPQAAPDSAGGWPLASVWWVLC